MTRKAISLIILSTLICAQMASCGGSAAGTDTTAAGGDTTAPVETTAPEIKPELPDKDYGGEVITIYMRDDDRFPIDMYVEEADGDIMNDAIYERNSAVEEQFNVKFEVYRQSGDKYGQQAGSSILAGDDTYDMIVPHARFVNNYAKDGMLADWNSALTYVDLDQPWWNQDCRKAYTFYNQIYAAIGDISYLNTGASVCMMFNKAMFDEYNLEYPYQLVLDGKWTFDKFGEYASIAAKDLNGDTKFDIETDQFGYATTWWSGPIQVLYSGEQRVCGKDENGAMMLTLNTEKTVDVFERFFALTDKEGMYIQLKDGDDDLNKYFSEGRIMFRDSQIKNTMALRDMKDDFGIIPWPKMDESVDKYYANVDAGCNLILVPVTATDLEMMSVVIEQLAYLGWRDVVPTYYDVVLQTKFTRDEESPAMIDIIREGRVFDIGYFYNIGALNSTGYNLTKTEDHNFTSFYAANESACQVNIDKINEQYRALTEE